MFKIKRPAMIGLLVVLLLFTSFLNYQLTQQSILKASSGYQEFELAEMESLNEERDVFSEESPTSNDVDNDEEDNNGIEEEGSDLKDSSTNDIHKLVTSRDENIGEVIDKDGENYFVNFRLSRDKLRAESIDRLEAIIKNELTEQSTRTEAQEEMMNINKASEKELQIEGLIQAKGFEDALVFMTKEDIKIVVSASELNEQDMVKILDIVKSETDLEMDKIKIMKKH